MWANGYWAVNQLSSVDLGDARRNRRASQLLCAMVKRPGEGLPKQTQTWGGLKAAYRLLNCPAITRNDVLTPHFELTRAAARGGPMLFIQDTTELDFTGHPAAQGFGPIGDSRGRGSLVHSLLAVRPDGRILGLAAQTCWTRSNGVPFKQKETRHQRLSRPDRESAVWPALLAEAGPVPADQFWVSVGDRGSDSFGYWKTAVDTGWQCLSRVYVNRGTDTGVLSLTRARTWPAQGYFELEQRARPGQAQRTLALQLAWDSVTLTPPKTCPVWKKAPPLDVTLVRCWDAEHQVEWLLLATWPIANLDQARQAVAWYAQRWTIEEFHKALKTGCKIERSQLEHAEAVETLLAFCSLVAVRLLALAREARNAPTVLAHQVIDPDWITVLCQHQRCSAKTLTLERYCREVAKLGGFLGRKSDGNPGWQTLWHGWVYLDALVTGFKLGKKCG